MIGLIALAMLAMAGVAAADSGAAWKSFSSPEGRFTALFPGTPSQQTQQTPTAAGSIATTLYTVTMADAYFGVVVGDYPPEVVSKKPDDLLDGARNGAVSQVGGTLLSEDRISSEGFPGREIKITATRGTQTMIAWDRMYLVKNRLYQAIVVMSVKNEGSKDVRKFLDSFHFTPR
jgi:hypothetical protein